MASHKLYITVFFHFFISKMICGNNITQTLMARFNDSTTECIDHNGHKRPACECSGIMIRGLADIGSPDSQQKYPWSTKIYNRESNAFSFSFLRKDQLFDGIVYDSGLIIYPHLKTPHGKKKYDVVCAFPVNAYTDMRDGHHGCGQLLADKMGVSNFCHTQGIITLPNWIQHHKEIMKDTDKKTTYPLIKMQCGFDMTSNKATERFALAMEVKKYLQDNSELYGWYYNELRIQLWDENKPEELPIEAFYYMINSKKEEKDKEKGKNEALMYQRVYKDLTGETVPVVGIQLPKKNHPQLILIE